MVKWREEVLFVIVYILFACILDSMMVDDIIRFSLCLVTLVTLEAFICYLTNGNKLTQELFR